MIYVEHEGRQLLVGAALMLVTATMQTFGLQAREKYRRRHPWFAAQDQKIAREEPGA